MHYGGMKSWQIGVGGAEPFLLGALWIRDVEHIEVPPDPTVPGPLDTDSLPAPSAAAVPGLGDEWLAWWRSSSPSCSPSGSAAGCPACSGNSGCGTCRSPVTRPPCTSPSCSCCWEATLHARSPPARSRATRPTGGGPILRGRAARGPSCTASPHSSSPARKPDRNSHAGSHGCGANWANCRRVTL